jgi:murein DD-endopeptidase MepM/ murein hydrolase activator NlpD
MRCSHILPWPLLLSAACAPGLRPLAATWPLPEPPAESPLPAEERVDRPTASAAEFDLLRSRGLMVPVAGVSPAQLTNTYDEPRDGGRRHEAVDILAHRGTAVLAADDGVIMRVGKNALGGNVIWAVDQQHQFAYYYAHLDHFARGLHEGQALARGEVIGFVGTTGNAPVNTPHLHFQAMRLLDEKRFSAGTAFDPLPYFTTPGVAP